MFENLQATDDDFRQSFLQNKCVPNLTISYPEQFGNEIVNRGNSLRANVKMLHCSLISRLHIALTIAQLLSIVAKIFRVSIVLST